VNHPDVEPINDRWYRLEEDWYFTVGSICARVPKGYRFDGASVPQVCWSFGFRPDGPWRSAALAHDYLYDHGGNVVGLWYEEGILREECVTLTRKQSDGVFLLLMKEGGVMLWKRQFMFRMVRMWGWIFFGKPNNLRKLRG